jgi:hypothetical protein
VNAKWWPEDVLAAVFPERTHKEHRPPAEWLKDAGITPDSLAAARKMLELEEPNFQAKRDVRAAVNDAMDAAYGKDDK